MKTQNCLIRLIDNSKPDAVIIKKWWKQMGVDYDINSLPDTTFILECDGKLQYAVPVFYTNGDRIYIEDFISDPELSSIDRINKSEVLLKAINDTAKEKGFKIIIGFAPDDKLLKRYEDLGFQKGLKIDIIFKDIR